ncbi:MAG: aminotransferase class I/II-fold pyridoxal phosphate-dependent enzyme [Bacteroidetes bacterium]|nr:aminotransferase class I/II-fold pyridoxal phosphate-dependent enzyme [Bacteroidota bacterium]
MSTSNKSYGFGSVCVMEMDGLPKNFHPHGLPIYANSTFSFETVEEGVEAFKDPKNSYIYTRWNNPTIAAAERKLAQLEANGLTDKNNEPLKLYGRLFSSGMGAISSLFIGALDKGDKILAHGSLYGGTEELFNSVLPKMGIEVLIRDLKDLDETEKIINDNPEIKLLYLESPSNPTLDCYDIQALAKMAKLHDIQVGIDNTVSTPYLQQPFRLGVDYVVHSTTKFLNGHGTAIGGALIAKDADFLEKKAWDTIKLLGSNCNAFDAWLLYNGMMTLELRMERHCSNAQKVAEFLDDHKKVNKVNYLGLPAHPDHELAKTQMNAFGGLLSFELSGGMQAGIDFLNSVEFCTFAVSLGTASTLVSHPASMTHMGLSPDKRAEYGINDGLIRMSVGIENVEDIIEDLKNAL